MKLTNWFWSWVDGTYDGVVQFFDDDGVVFNAIRDWSKE